MRGSIDKHAVVGSSSIDKRIVGGRLEMRAGRAWKPSKTGPGVWR
jgi:hypothetical protein